MPDINLKDDEFLNEEDDLKNQRHSSRYKRSQVALRLRKIFVILIIVGLGLFLLNQVEIIHLWGEREKVVIVELPPLDQDESIEAGDTRDEPIVTGVMVQPESIQALGIPTEQPKEYYTVQVSASRDKSKAEAHASRIRAAGKEAFIEESIKSGETWYRVRVGKYSTREEAERDTRDFRSLFETGWWIDHVKE